MKENLEKSLKRYLKRKVKITLGFITAFAIMGNVGLAAENDDIISDLKEKQKNYELVKENLKYLGSSLEAKDYTIKDSDGNNEKTINVSTLDNNTTIDFSKIKGNTKITFENKFLSGKTKETIENSLENSYIVCSDNNGIVVAENKGVIIANASNAIAQKSDEITKDIVNNGILFGLQSGTEGTAINNGIIYSSANSSVNQGITTGKAINNGFIYAGNFAGQFSSFGQQVKSGKNGIIINNGVIKSVYNYGQSMANDVSEATAYNYGIIEGKGGQGAGSITSKSSFINYGTINVVIDDGIGQNISTDQGNTAYNYGLIKVIKGSAMNGNGKKYNYGVIKAGEESNIFGGNGTNISKGIIISDNSTITEKYGDTSAIFNSNYELQNKNALEIDTKLNSNNFSQNVAVIKNGNAELNGLFSDKTIASVVTEDINSPVFTIGSDKIITEDNIKLNGEVVLKDTSLVGYFENSNGGTLLEVGAGKTLTLDGNTQITAVKDLQSETGDIYALELKEDSTLNLVGSKISINGVIKGDIDTNINAYNFDSNIKIDGGNLTVANILDKDLEGYLKENNYTRNAEIEGEIDNLTFNLSNTVIDSETGESKINHITVKDGTVIKENGKFEDLTEVGNKVEVVIEDVAEFAQNLDGLDFGKGNNDVIINNTTEEFNKYINLGEGEDKFVINGYAQDINTFNFNVVNAETVELNGGTWGNWKEAKGTIKFDDNSKKPKMVLGDNTTMNITLNASGKYGSDFANYIGTTLGMEHAVITGTGNDSTVKYLISENGLDSANLSTDKYSFGEGVSYTDSPIFNISSTEGEGVKLSVKTAEEMGVSGQERIIYEAYLNQIKAGNANKDVINQINGFDTSKDFVDAIKHTDMSGRAYYTAGSVVTKDIVNSYVGAVEDFRKRAAKGEWLAQGKYINSDTEFDGGSSVRGYDGDITGTIGMIEYGLTENTAYGVVFGKGDSEIDINGGGKLDGDNIYTGLYMKHRTANDIELVANIGYIESDMDSELRNDFTGNNGITINGTTFEKGTADSSAVILSLRGRKDYKLSDSVKLQPTLGARATIINQEKAENPEMHFSIEEQDIIVLEGIAGMGIAKDFEVYNGKFELNTGVEYTFTTSNTNNDAEYTLFEGSYEATHIKMDDVDVAENTGKVYVGFDYEHENGVGFNGKYEMMWSDKGDDNRMEVGISYRF